MKFFSNKDIVKLLRSVSAAYTVKGGDRFKIIAYDRAADSIDHSTSETKDLWEEGKLDSVPGLGKSMQAHLDELFKTGKVDHFQEVMKGLPEGMFELLDIPGMGPKNAYKLSEKLKLRSIDDLEKAATNGKIRALPGFGEKSEKDILNSISELRKRSGRYILPYAHAITQRFLDYLRTQKECEIAEPLGSLRRMTATVGDIDIGVASNQPQKIVEHFQKFHEVKRILEAGERTASVILKNGVQVDLKIQPRQSFGALLQHFTGSKNHNIHLREIAKQKDMSLSEYGIKIKSKINKFDNEHDFYKALGMDYIEPELREDSGEIEAAIAHQLPKLVESQDIKGDVHIHSSYPIEPSHDLGANTFQEIINKAKKLKYEYIGFSDHSPGYHNHTKRQIIDLIKKRKKQIEQLKSSNKTVGILNLLEIDLLANGELSVPEEGLILLDGVIAGIHSGHHQDKKMITKRLLKACYSPYVKVISHPTNRLLQERESSDADWPTIFEACVKTKTVLEINAWPSRLDLPDTLTREAIKSGVKLIINSDAHAVDQMENIKFGVAVARRGWATKKDIINTLPWTDFRKHFTKD